MLKLFKSRLGAMRRSEDGAVAVEFALLAPFLFMLLFGIVCVGYAIGINHSLHQLATSAARASLDGLNYQERQSEVDAYLSEAGSFYPLLDMNALSSTAVISQGGTPHINVTVNYDLDASVLSLANGFLGLNLSQFSAGAYLAY